jgi:hypothetical protein
MLNFLKPPICQINFLNISIIDVLPHNFCVSFWFYTMLLQQKTKEIIYKNESSRFVFTFSECKCDNKSQIPQLVLLYVHVTKCKRN